MDVLITGANRGLGLEMVAEALERGHAVIAGVRNPAMNSAKLEALAEKHGKNLIVAELDVTDEAGLADFASRLKSEGKILGAIVNNAAILSARNTPIEDLDFDDVVNSFNINLFGHILIVLADVCAGDPS